MHAVGIHLACGNELNEVQVHSRSFGSRYSRSALSPNDVFERTLDSELFNADAISA